jgi:hypothetical protein
MLPYIYFVPTLPFAQSLSVYPSALPPYALPYRTLNSLTYLIIASHHYFLFLISLICPHYIPHTLVDMGGNTEYIAGHGYLSLGQAVHVAQNSEGGVDQRLAQVLERRLAEVWTKLNAQPTSYVLPPDEFALLNYYRTRFGDNEVIRNATKRFWDNHKGVQ